LAIQALRSIGKEKVTADDIKKYKRCRAKKRKASWNRIYDLHQPG
jgi:hypothetical protein